MDASGAGVPPKDVTLADHPTLGACVFPAGRNTTSGTRKSSKVVQRGSENISFQSYLPSQKGLGCLLGNCGIDKCDLQGASFKTKGGWQRNILFEVPS